VAGLVLYNTRTRRKEAFEPIQPGEAKVYTCGPTVYAAPHLGNMYAYLFADLLKRALQAEGLEVTQVINVTDVGHLTDDADAGEDKMEAAAARTGKRAEEIADEYTRQWIHDRERLFCLAPAVLCKATEHIPQQIALAQTLEEKGFTYRIEDGIYFDTSKFPRYAEFARLDLAGQESSARIGDVAGKKNPADFALWKFAAEGVSRQQEWDSPWGRGFPGWHLECSAMSTQYLGEAFDIHTGGVDHISVHHTNEIAQSECAYDVHPWVRVWMHCEFVDFRGEKMSKSTGNVLTLDDLVERGIPPLAFRYFFLQAHYRQQQTFTDEAIDAAATGYDRLLRVATEVRFSEGRVRDSNLAPFQERFRQAIRDDLNTPRALAVSWDVARSSDLSGAEKAILFRDFDDVLGIDLREAIPQAEIQESDPRIDELVARREQARADREFDESDRIRDLLADEGIVVDDTPGGPRWRRR
jgi:cysteinyl-tRNA synthetase